MQVYRVIIVSDSYELPFPVGLCDCINSADCQCMWVAVHSDIYLSDKIKIIYISFPMKPLPCSWPIINTMIWQGCLANI